MARLDNYDGTSNIWKLATMSSPPMPVLDEHYLLFCFGLCGPGKLALIFTAIFEIDYERSYRCVRGGEPNAAR